MLKVCFSFKMILDCRHRRFHSFTVHFTRIKSSWPKSRCFGEPFQQYPGRDPIESTVQGKYIEKKKMITSLQVFHCTALPSLALVRLHNFKSDVQQWTAVRVRSAHCRVSTALLDTACRRWPCRSIQIGILSIPYSIVYKRQKLGSCGISSFR